MPALKFNRIIGAAAVILIGATQLPAQAQTDIPVPPFGPAVMTPADQMTGTAAVEALHEDIATRLRDLESLQFDGSELSCWLFGFWTAGIVDDGVADRHRELALRIGEFSADEQRRAAEDIATYVRRIGEMVREGCPKIAVGQTGNQNVQNAPEPQSPPPRILEGEELRRAMPNVAIALPPRIELSNQRLQDRANSALNKMQTGIDTRSQALYDEGRREMTQIFSELTRALNQLLATPLDTNTDTREAKQERAETLYDELYLIDGFLRSVTYPEESLQPVNRIREVGARQTAGVQTVVLSDPRQQAILDGAIRLMKQGIANCDRVTWQLGLDELKGIEDRLRNSNQNALADLVAIIYPDLMFPACTPPTLIMSAGIEVERSEETDRVESFGYRRGGLEVMTILRLSNVDTNVGYWADVELPSIAPSPSRLFEGPINQAVKLSFSSSSARVSAPMIPSFGDDLLLPGASNPGVFLPGAGTATDLTDVEMKYEGFSFSARYRLSTDVEIGENTTLELNGGPVVNIRDIDISSSGNIPNFGFGPMFGFSYNSNINVRELGGSVGATIKGNLPGPAKQFEWMIGATVDLLLQDVDGTDIAFLGGGGAGTLVRDTAQIGLNDSAVSYNVFAGFTMNPTNDENVSVSVLGFMNESQDSFYVERSGAVGGMARLRRDDATSVGGRIGVNIQFK